MSLIASSLRRIRYRKKEVRDRSNEYRRESGSGKGVKIIARNAGDTLLIEAIRSRQARLLAGTAEPQLSPRLDRTTEISHSDAACDRRATMSSRRRKRPPSRRAEVTRDRVASRPFVYKNHLPIIAVSRRLLSLLIISPLIVALL